jgi:hypothetical protein
MKKSKFSEDQIAFGLREVAGGAMIAERRSRHFDVVQDTGKTRRFLREVAAGGAS